jgi:hypothetical protein
MVRSELARGTKVLIPLMCLLRKGRALSLPGSSRYSSKYSSGTPNPVILRLELRMTTQAVSQCMYTTSP